MSPKRQAETGAARKGEGLKKRKSISMEIKLDCIRRHEAGEKPTAIGQRHGLARSTVTSILVIIHGGIDRQENV